MPTNIITLQELTDYFDGETLVADSPYDLIRVAVCAFLESQCGRDFSADSNNRQEIIDVMDSHTNKLRLKKPPVISFGSLLSGRTSQETVDADTYVVDTELGIIKKVYDYFIEGVSQYTAVYKGGFSAIPGDLKLLAKRLVSKEIMHTKKSRFGVRSLQFQQGQVEYLMNGMDAFEQQILERYTLERFF